MLGNPADLLHLQKTCRGTREFFGERDAVWMYCKDEYEELQGDSRLPTAREKVLTAWMLQRCEEEQEEKNGNVLVEEFHLTQLGDAPAWRGFASFLQQCISHDRPRLVYSAFSNVHRLSESDAEYPILTKKDVVRGFRQIKTETDTQFKQGYDTDGWPAPSFPAPIPLNDEVVRRLAFKAGIIRVHPDAFETIWEFVLRITFLILTKTAPQAHLGPSRDAVFEPSPDQVILAAKSTRLPVAQVYFDFDQQRGSFVEGSQSDDGSDDDDDSSSDNDAHDSESEWSWTEENYDSDVDDDCTLDYDSDADSFTTNAISGRDNSGRDI
ncbi:MAG: hypothetical protein SGARI_004269 [Bacillariaceae sp.]